jgi:hypothetical protein
VTDVLAEPIEPSPSCHLNTHRAAAEHHAKGDHAKGKEHSTSAQQHSQNARQHSEQAHTKSQQQK